MLCHFCCIGVTCLCICVSVCAYCLRFIANSHSPPEPHSPPQLFLPTLYFNNQVVGKTHSSFFKLCYLMHILKIWRALQLLLVIKIFFLCTSQPVSYTYLGFKSFTYHINRCFYFSHAVCIFLYCQISGHESGSWHLYKFVCVICINPFCKMYCY